MSGKQIHLRVESEHLIFPLSDVYLEPGSSIKLQYRLELAGQVVDLMLADITYIDDDAEKPVEEAPYKKVLREKGATIDFSQDDIDSHIWMIKPWEDDY